MYVTNRRFADILYQWITLLLFQWFLYQWITIVIFQRKNHPLIGKTINEPYPKQGLSARWRISFNRAVVDGGRWLLVSPSLKLANMPLENRPGPKRKSSLSTTTFQVQAVGFREGMPWICMFCSYPTVDRIGHFNRISSEGSPPRFHWWNLHPQGCTQKTLANQWDYVPVFNWCRISSN